MAKKKIFKIILSIVIVLVVAVLGFLAYYFFGVVGVESKRTYGESDAVVQNVDTGKTVLDDTVTYQTMNGFGASACWWSQDIGKWENSEEILSYLYDSDKG
ncbi:MAG: hypothetical protein J1E36_08950, partial [Eubacterium sp.]|nr:hypothetical protein [Eubacterium sp.]